MKNKTFDYRLIHLYNIKIIKIYKKGKPIHENKCMKN